MTYDHKSRVVTTIVWQLLHTLDRAAAEGMERLSLPVDLLRDVAADLLELRGEDIKKTAADNDREAERYMAL